MPCYRVPIRVCRQVTGEITDRDGGLFTAPDAETARERAEVVWRQRRDFVEVGTPVLDHVGHREARGTTVVAKRRPVNIVPPSELDVSLSNMLALIRSRRQPRR